MTSPTFDFNCIVIVIIRKGEKKVGKIREEEEIYAASFLSITVVGA